MFPNGAVLTLLACLLNVSSIQRKLSAPLSYFKVTRIACSHSIPNIDVGSNCLDKGEGKELPRKWKDMRRKREKRAEKVGQQ